MKNYVVVAIDAQLRDHLTARGINMYYKDIQVGRLRLRASTCPVCVLMLQLLCALGTLHGVAEQPLPHASGQGSTNIDAKPVLEVPSKALLRSRSQMPLLHMLKHCILK